MKGIKSKVGAFLVGILIGVSVTGVFASIAYGIWGYYGPQLDYNYKNRNSINADDALNSISATTVVARDGSGTIPEGYMGTQVRVFKDDALHKSGVMQYNPSATSSYTAAMALIDVGVGTYYTKGITAAYNGSGYYTYSSYQSPSQNIN